MSLRSIYYGFKFRSIKIRFKNEMDTEVTYFLNIHMDS